jgi:O-antigen/teichoic acid export membrane protein
VIGDARFGVLSLIWLLFGYFGLFDFGLSRATANRLAQLRFGDPQERASVFYTALMLNAGLGIVAGATFYFAALPLLTYLSSSAGSLSTELPGALPWIAILFPFGMIGGVLTGSLEAEERFFTINVQQIVGSILFQCLPLLAVLLTGPSLTSAVIGAAVAKFILLAWNACVSVTIVRRGARFRVSLYHAPSLLKYGSWMTVTNVISPLLESADQFLIARMLGPVAVAHYAVPFNFAMKTRLLAGSLSGALFPRFSRLEKDAALDLARHSIRVLAWVMALVCAPAIFVVNYGLTIWVGHDFATAATPVAQALLIGTWFNSVALVPCTLLQAQGRPDINAKFHMLEIAPFLILLWAMLNTYGITGAAYAWVARVAFDCVLLMWATGNLRESGRLLVLPGMVVVASWFWASVFPATPSVAFVEFFATGSCVLAYMYFTDELIFTLVEKWLKPSRSVQIR